MPSVKRKETIEYLALVAEIIAAAGVIISVIYLALQVNDSNIEMRAQTHYNALTLAQRPLEMLVERPELGELVTKALHKGHLSKKGKFVFSKARNDFRIFNYYICNQPISYKSEYLCVQRLSHS
jgi:hypothetical protein